MNEVDVVSKAIGDRSLVVPRRATFVARTSSGQATVAVDGAQFTVDFATDFMPRAGDSVHIWQIDGLVFLVGPVTARPTRGLVTATSSTALTVNSNAGLLTGVPFVGAQPLAGDTVALGWSDGPVCLGRLSNVPSAPPVITPTPTPGTVRSATFFATDSGSTDRDAPRWWTAQPWASNSTFGAWFYGNQIKDTIPAGAQFVSLGFYVSWVSRGGSAPRFALHNHGAKSTVPGFGAYVEWAPGSGWQTPPNPEAWFNGLKAGGAWAGVGLNQGGINKFASRAQDGSSGALSIAWKE